MRTTLLKAVAGASAAVLAIAAAPVIGDIAPLGAATDEPDPHVASTNVDWITQVRYPELVGDESNVDEQGGTDLEVGSLTVLDAAGEQVVRDYAFAGTYVNGFQVVDVTDPEQPELVTTYECNVRQGDIQVMTRPDMIDEATGLPRTFVTYAIDNSAGSGMQSDCFTDLQANNQMAFLAASTNSGGGSLIFDVTDPAAPFTVGFIPAGGGTHNGTINGFDTDDDGTVDDWLFYNSENDAGGNLEIWDINDPTNTELVTTLTLGDSATDTHDVTFNADGSRAYVASIVVSYILNTEDPRSPTLVSRIVDPGNGIHHQADPITVATPLGDRTYVIISDEVAGAAGNGYCPGGGMHVWDVTVEEAPVKVGAYFMPDIAVQEGAHTGAGGLVSCTSHVFRMYPEHQIMTIGNMAGGVRVIDVSGLVGVSAGDENTSTGEVAGMRDLGWWRFTGTDETGSDSWAFKAHPDRFEVHEDGSVSFHAFSSDQTRGLEVYHFDGSEPAAEAESGEAERGTWGSPLDAVDRWNRLTALFTDDALLYSCRFPDGIGAGSPAA